MMNDHIVMAIREGSSRKLLNVQFAQAMYLVIRETHYSESFDIFNGYVPADVNRRKRMQKLKMEIRDAVLSYMMV